MGLPADQREVVAGTTPVFTATLKDHAGTAIPAAALTSLTLTLWSRKSGIAIRDQQNVLNANGVSIHATSGLVTWTLSASDTALSDADPNVDAEQRIYRFDWSWVSGSTTYVGSSGQDYFRVTNPDSRRQEQ
jgi:hypothetical protein